MENSHSKTEKATPKRQLKARTEGQFPTSRELVAAFQFLLFLVIALSWFSGWFRGMKYMLRAALETAFHSGVEVQNLPTIAWPLLRQAMLPLAMICGLTSAGTLALHLSITRMGFSFKKFIPDLNRLSPAGKFRV